MRGELRFEPRGVGVPSAFRGVVGGEFGGLRRGEIALGGVVEEGVELVKIALAEGIVFVRVTLGARERDAEPDGAERAHAVHDGLGAVFLLIHAALFVREGLAKKTGGDFLFERGVGQEIAGELFNRELIEGLVAIERADDPVAIHVGEGARGIFFVTVAVGVVREIEPVTRPVLAKMWRGKQTLDEIFVGAGRGVGEEFSNLFGRGREAGEVEAEAANERGFVGLGRGGDGLFFEAREDEVVDGRANPRGVRDAGRRGADGRFEGPMLELAAIVSRGVVGPRRAGIDPRAEDADVARREWRAFARHEFAGHRAADVVDEAALGALAGNDDAAIVAAGEGFGFVIETQAVLLFGGAVTGVTFRGEQRLHVADEIHRAFGRGREFGGGKRVGGCRAGGRSQQNAERQEWQEVSHANAETLAAAARRAKEKAGVRKIGGEKLEGGNHRRGGGSIFRSPIFALTSGVRGLSRTCSSHRLPPGKLWA